MDTQSVERLLAGLIVVLVLILLGVLAFGAGVVVTAERGLGVGAWGAVHLGPGPEQREGLVRVAKPDTEGMLAGVTVPEHMPAVSTAAGIWDTAGGQQAIAGPQLTTVGYEDKYIHNNDYMPAL
jgi:hypothetical protein